MIIVSHPTGNANARAALNGLHQAGLLAGFHTSIATYPGNIFATLGKIGPLNDFGRRAFSPALRPLTQLHPSRELLRLLATRLGLHGLVRHETGPLSVDAVYHHLDRRVAAALARERPRAVYSYEDGAKATFQRARELGILPIYDLPIGYWRAARRLLGEVVERAPEWAATVRGLQDSAEKLARKDDELRLAEHVFVASSFTASTLREYPGDLGGRVHVVPYGFPPAVRERTYDAGENRPMRLLFVGGLSQRKGIAEMFHAVGQLGKHVDLTIVGGKPVPDCAALNAALRQHRYIPSLPHAEVLSLMRQHDLLLFPSHFEGFGLVITEAMSQGTPVITTERTAGPDLIEHDRDGILVPAGDAEALTVQIEALLRRPARIAELGHAAAARAARRPWSTYGRELAAALQNILS